MRGYCKVTLWGAKLELPVTTGNKNKDVRYAFSNGQCHSLARALHRLTGWPLYVLVEDYDGAYQENSDDVGTSESGTHVVVRMPDGRFVDIKGAWEWDDRSDSWWDTIYVPASDHVVANLGWDAQDVPAAMPFARAVLREMGYRHLAVTK